MPQSQLQSASQSTFPLCSSCTLIYLFAGSKLVLGIHWSSSWVFVFLGISQAKVQSSVLVLFFLIFLQVVASKRGNPLCVCVCLWLALQPTGLSSTSISTSFYCLGPPNQPLYSQCFFYFLECCFPSCRIWRRSSLSQVYLPRHRFVYIHCPGSHSKRKEEDRKKNRKI